MLENKIPARHDFFYEHTFRGSPGIPKVEGVVTQNLKYMKYIEHDYEELYDIDHDPHETTNLISDPMYKEALTRLRTRYADLKKDVK